MACVWLAQARDGGMRVYIARMAPYGKRPAMAAVYSIPYLPIYGQPAASGRGSGSEVTPLFSLPRRGRAAGAAPASSRLLVSDSARSDGASSRLAAVCA